MARLSSTCIESSGPLVYDDVEEAVARTLLADDLHTGSDATMIMRAISNPKYLLTFTDKSPVHTFLMRLLVLIRGRRLAITDTGYMCLVPACAEIVDAVAVFSGHPTPFTIRLEPGSEMGEAGLERVHARLVGDTYVHGVMNGEMIIEAMKTGRKPSEIVLI